MSPKYPFLCSQNPCQGKRHYKHPGTRIICDTLETGQTRLIIEAALQPVCSPLFQWTMGVQWNKVRQQCHRCIIFSITPHLSLTIKLDSGQSCVHCHSSADLYWTLWVLLEHLLMVLPTILRLQWLTSSAFCHRYSEYLPASTTTDSLLFFHISQVTLAFAVEPSTNIISHKLFAGTYFLQSLSSLIHCLSTPGLLKRHNDFC